MKALLMHRDLDFELQQELPANERELMHDLEIGTLLRAMSGEDPFLFNVAHKALLSGPRNHENTILYRHAILKDCLKNPALARDIYALAVEAIERRNKSWFGFYSRYPSSILASAIETLAMLAEMLEKLRSIAELHAGRVDSEGFVALFAMLRRELDDEYFGRIHNHLKELKFNSGLLMSAELGPGNQGTGYVLRLARDKKPPWLSRLLGKGPGRPIVRALPA